MRFNEALIYSFDQLRDTIHRTVDGLDVQALAWRPDPEANSIGWLVWHLTRVQDDHIAEIAGVEQVWVAGRWAERFGLPADYTDIGYGHSADEVAAIAPQEPAVLGEYHDDVADMTMRALESLDDFDRIIDRSFDPPVTVGVRLMSVTSDTLQHLGQAGYVRGLLSRRGNDTGQL